MGPVERVAQASRVGQVGQVGQVGFSLIELVVAMAIWLVILAGIFTALELAYGRFGVETDASDANQRLRAAVQALSDAFVKAAAVVPDGQGAVTVVVLDDGASRTTTAAAMPRRSGGVPINLDAGCPVGDASCGFTMGDTVVILEPGEFDPFAITAVAGPDLTLAHLAADGAGSHPPGAAIARAVVRTFFLDDEGQIVRQDAGGSAVPIVDGATALAFEYYAAGGAALADLINPSAIEAVGTRLSVGTKAGDLTASWRITPRNLRGAP